jgi:RNA polymerase primary sigma factor
MPPLPRISVPALARLAEDLRFAPRDALVRDLDRIERLAAEVDEHGEFPEEWISFRITGFRADAGVDTPKDARGHHSSGAPVAGRDLLRDLSALAERLSAAARLTAPEGSLTLAELASRWSVSTKTIERLRRRGLIARRVLDSAGRSRLAFASHVIDHFATAHPEEIRRAAAYSRTPAITRARVIRCARLYRAVGLSLNQAALRIALRYGRSHEAIRQQLIRHDQLAAERAQPAIFAWRGSLRSTRTHDALEHIARGVEPRAIARRLGRSPHAVRRATNILRADRLRSLALGSPPHSTPARAALEPAPALTAPPLDSPHARDGLGEPGTTDLLAFIRAARLREVPLGVVERARAVALCSLLGRAALWIAALDHAWPSPGALDTIETALRWAARLKAELLRAHLALIIQTIEARAALKLDEQRAPRALQLVELGLNAAARAIDAFDPAKGGRVAAPITLLVTRDVSRWIKAAPAPEPEPAGRALPRLTSGIEFPDWTRRVAPWQEWLEPDPLVRPRVDAVPADARLAMALRHGWPDWTSRTSPAPARPHTCAEIAALLSITPTAVARLERLAIREALAAPAPGTAT